jgi:hypothetical protein
VIVSDVPPDSLAVGRGKQIVKKGWAKKLREKRSTGPKGKGGKRKAAKRR